MATAEKLLAQIFERRSSIIEQVKQQAELYIHHRASKLLIDGIAPPSWLWNPSTSSDCRGLNKEEVIAKLLRPYPQSVYGSVAHHPVYSNILINGDNEEVSNEVAMGNLAFNKGLNRQEDPSVPALVSENLGPGVLNSVSELESSVTLVKHKTDVGISNSYSAPDRSRGGIRRSKSRQKALEVHNSEKALAKSGLSQENASDVPCSQITFSPCDTNRTSIDPSVSSLISEDPGQCALNSVPEIDASVTPTEHKTDVRVFESPSAVDRSLAGIQRSKSRQKALELRNSTNALARNDLIHENVSDVLSSQIRFSLCATNLECQKDELPNSAEPRVICPQNCEDGDLNKVGCINKEKGMDAYSGRITRSRSHAKSQGFVSGSETLGCLSEDCNDNASYHIANTRMSESLPISVSEQANNYAHKSPITARPSTLCSQICLDGKIGGADCLNKEVPSQSAKADDGVFAPPSGRSAQEANDSNEKVGISKPSVGLFRRVTRLQTLSSGKESYEPVAYSEDSRLEVTMSKSDFKQKSAENNDRVDPSCSYSSGHAMQRRELESQSEHTRTGLYVFVEPKQSSLNDTVNCNLKAFTSNSGKRILDNLSENMKCSLSNAALSLDKEISGDDEPSLSKQSLGVSVVSSKGKETERNSFDSNLREDFNSQGVKFGPVISDTVSKTSEDETDSMLYKMVDISLIQTQLGKVHVEQGIESLPERHMEEEGEQSRNEKDKHKLVSSLPENQHLRLSNCHNSAKQPIAESCGCSIGKVEMTNQHFLVFDKVKQLPSQESQNLSCLEDEACSRYGDSCPGAHDLVTHSTVSSNGENSSPERRFRNVSMESWPQLKKRKIAHNQTHSFTTSRRYSVGKRHDIERGPACRPLENMETNVDTILMDTSHVNKNTDIKIQQKIDSSLTEGSNSTFLSQNGEVGFCHKEKNEHENSSSITNNEQLGEVSVSLADKESRHSQGLYVEGIRTTHSTNNNLDVGVVANGQWSQHLNTHSSEDLTLTNKLLEGTQSPKWDDCLQTQHSVFFPLEEDLEHIHFEESIPVFEGFRVDAQADSDELDFAADGIEFGKLNLSGSTIDRASTLIDICKSASLNTPLSQLSSAFEFKGAQNLYRSVPNDRLKHLDLGSVLPQNNDVGKQLQSSSMPYYDFQPYSNAQYGWNSRNQHASPVGKLWERLSSHSGSSGKSLSSNPELTCFRIEEDPSISEDYKSTDENADDVEGEMDPLSANHCDRREPLKNLTNLGLDRPLPLVTGTQGKVLSSPKNQSRNKSETRKKQMSCIGAADGRKNQSSSIGAKGIKKTKESFNNSISQPTLPNKTNLKRQVQKLSLKESKKNNIVSNVNSFIPLIQQKQAATVCTGKRDVKVKALEAAEAAKRLEEKRENERKVRKEALKLERATLEEKNMRHMELEKKKKEEERKKKDAHIIARKRLREEEERKEKEKKRMRLDARQQQREQEEKKRANKVEKEKQRSKDEPMNNKKELHKESKQERRDTAREEDIASKRTDVKLAPGEVVMNYEECRTSGQSCEAGKAMKTLDKSPRNEDMIVHHSQGKSYEISPYQCSDDEDEEDDELPTKKHVPSWASKSSMALLLPLHQEMDPDKIFSPESFCSMDEVLLPRKLQQKQKQSS